jgi:hypothetical protein
MVRTGKGRSITVAARKKRIFRQCLGLNSRYCLTIIIEIAETMANAT